MSTASPEGLLHAHTDERLAALAAEGGQRAFALLVERHHPALLAFARKTVGHERADDVLQQSLLQAWSAIRGGTEVHHVRGWLFQIVRRAAWQATEQGVDHAELPGTLVGSEGPHAGLEERMRLRQVVEDVGRLPQQQRLALVQTALEGRSRAEVATSLGVTEGAVRQLLHRGRERLRQAAAAIVPFPVIRWLTRVSGHQDRSGVAAQSGVAATSATAVVAKVTLGLLATGAVAAGANQELRRLHAAPPASSAATAGELAGPSSAIRSWFTSGPGRTAIGRSAGGAALMRSALPGGDQSVFLPVVGAAAEPAGAAGEGQQPPAIDGPAGATSDASHDAGAPDVPGTAGPSTGDGPGTPASSGASSHDGGTSSGTSSGGSSQEADTTADVGTSPAGTGSPDSPPDPAPVSSDPAAEPPVTDNPPPDPAAPAEPLSPDAGAIPAGPSGADAPG